MGGQLEDKKEYISLAKAAEGTPYSQEYLSLRARQGKLKAVKLGKNWATKREWVEEYILQKDQGEYISLAQVARESPYSQEYLSLRARQGKLKAVKLGRNWATKREWLEEYLVTAQDYRQELNRKIENNIVRHIEGPVAVALKETELIQPTKKQTRENKKKSASKILRSDSPAIVFGRPKQPALRLGIVVALAFFVLASSLAFGQGGIQGVVNDVKTAFTDLGQKSKLVLDSIADDLKNGGVAGIGLVLDFSLPLVSDETGGGSALAGATYRTTVWQETAHVFSSYFEWLGDKLGGIFVARPKTVSWGEDNNRISIIEAKIDSISQFLEQGNYTGDSIASLREDIDYLKEHGVITKEVIKEIQQITQVLPKQIIETQTTIDFATTQELKELKTQLALIQEWESEIGEKIQSYPAGQVSHSSAPVYIASQGLQVGGNATFASLGISGSGSATNFSVGENMQIGTLASDDLLVYATSNFESPVTVNNYFYVGSDNELIIDSSGNISTAGTITSAGDIIASGNLSTVDITAQDLVLTGNITVAGSQTYSGATSITASSTGTSSALTVNQTGTGRIASFQQGGNDKVVIDNSGYLGIGTTTPSTELYVIGTATLQTAVVDSLTATATSFSTLSVSGTSTFNGVSYIWPSTDGTSTYALITDGGGNLSWGQTGVNDAEYVVLTANSALTDERVLTGTADQIILTDNGANNTIVLSLPQNIATTSSPTFAGLTLTNPLTNANGGTGQDTSAWTGLLRLTSGTWGTTTIDISGDTNLAAAGTLLQLVGDTLSIKEGTLTTTKGCKYVSGTGIVCDQDYILLTNLSSTATGLTYSNTTGVFSLTTNYEIPLTASTTQWDTAYGWGDWNGNIDISDDTNATTSGTLMTLTGDTFSIAEGTLTNGKLCTFVTGTGIVCDYTDVDTQLSSEQVQDIVGAMTTGNTQ
ncbi:hypothetical protein KJ616_00405, partial [Patescibacteria group bacterium]|nr:hypothetical protein [Patescibacteria group bacterium]